MRNFNNRAKGNNSRGGDFNRRDSGSRRFSGGDRGRSQMHEAICSDCGKRCEVPFRPTGDKPVYCNECFSSHREGPSSNRFERRGGEKPRFQDKSRFDAICDKCGKKFDLPFRPSGDKPVYCNECFKRDDNSSRKNNNTVVNQYKEQFDMLNSKLDRIIKVLIPVIPTKEEKKGLLIEKKKRAIEKKEKTTKPKKA